MKWWCKALAEIAGMLVVIVAAAAAAMIAVLVIGVPVWMIQAMLFGG